MKARIKDIEAETRASSGGCEDSFTDAMREYMWDVYDFKPADNDGWWCSPGVAYRWHESWLDFHYKGEDEVIFLSGKIAAIKLVRCVSDLDLVQSKSLVECWVHATHQPKDCVITDFDSVMSLLATVGEVAKGRWAVTDSGTIVKTHLADPTVPDQEIRALKVYL